MNNYTNYGHWNNLLYTEDNDLHQKQLAWIWELRSYFGLTFAQVQEMQEKWNEFFNDAKTAVLDSVPVIGTNITQTSVAYW